MPTYVGAGDVQISGRVTNLVSEVITSLQLEYQVDGEFQRCQVSRRVYSESTLRSALIFANKYVAGMSVHGVHIFPFPARRVFTFPIM